MGTGEAVEGAAAAGARAARLSPPPQEPLAATSPLWVLGSEERPAPSAWPASPVRWARLRGGGALGFGRTAPAGALHFP